MNHSRSTLVLMEQIIMVLVFALAAALCVQVFVYASVQSRRNDQRDRAVELAQSAVETMKHSGGSVSQAHTAAMEALGGQLQQDVWVVYYDADWQETADTANYTYRLSAQGRTQTIEGLCQSDVFVTGNAANSDDAPLITLTAAWQEVDGDA